MENLYAWMGIHTHTHMHVDTYTTTLKPNYSLPIINRYTYTWSSIFPQPSSYNGLLFKTNFKKTSLSIVEIKSTNFLQAYIL